MSKITASILVMTGVTALLRFLPFLVLRGGKTPPLLEKLTRGLPCAVMGMLVVYCLRGTDLRSVGSVVPALSASAAAVLLYLWRKDTLIGIVGATAVYMLLVQLVF